LKVAISAIAAGGVLGSYPFIAWVNRDLRRADAGAMLQESAYPPTVSKRKAVSQISVATKTIVPVVKFRDFLCNGGVNEEAGWIAST
jgi:hypothetical protein